MMFMRVTVLGMGAMGAGMAQSLLREGFDVTVWNRNLMNLLEMPLLFYVVSIAFYVTHQVTPRVLTLAWVYLALRLAHSLVHVTSNQILVRLTSYAASNVVLLTLWIRFISRVG